MIKGIDVSKWQSDMDWIKAADAGAVFAFMRASSATTAGLPYVDFQFERNSIEAPQHLLVGHYHYLRPLVTAVQQADYFCDLLENVERHLPPVCDIEQAGPVSRVHEFVDRVRERLGVWPLIYTGVFVWQDNYAAGFNRPCDLWIARYQVADPFYDGPLDPWGFDWRFWQYTDKGPGAEYGAGSASIDLNWWYGSYDDLLEYAGVAPEPPDPSLESRVAAIEAAMAALPLHTHLKIKPPTGNET